MATTAVHNGSKFSQSHNRRDFSEPHIDPAGHYEVWRDEAIKQAYHRLFDKSLAVYNDKQKRDDRKIKSYYDHVRKSKTLKVGYEMIVGVYGKDVDDKTRYEILKKFVRTWHERNPNLELIGAYYHADEEGQPHLHIDYIPVARNCTRGLATQCSLKGALKAMGLVTTKGKGTAQMQLEKANLNFLDELCKERGISVQEHGQQKLQHLDTKTYKATAELKSVVAANEKIASHSAALQKEVNVLNAEKLTLQRQKQKLGKEVDKLEKRLKNAPSEREMQKMSKRYEQIKKEVDHLETKKSSLQEQVKDLDYTRTSYSTYLMLLSVFKHFLKIAKELLGEKYKTALKALKCDLNEGFKNCTRPQASALHTVVDDLELDRELQSLKSRTRSPCDRDR